MYNTNPLLLRSTTMSENKTANSVWLPRELDQELAALLSKQNSITLYREEAEDNWPPIFAISFGVFDNVRSHFVIVPLEWLSTSPPPPYAVDIPLSHMFYLRLWGHDCVIWRRSTERHQKGLAWWPKDFGLPLMLGYVGNNKVDPMKLFQYLVQQTASPVNEIVHFNTPHYEIGRAHV